MPYSKGGFVGGKPGVNADRMIVANGTAYMSRAQYNLLRRLVHPNAPSVGHALGGLQIYITDLIDWAVPKKRAWNRSRTNSKNIRKRKHGRQTRTPR